MDYLKRIFFSLRYACNVYNNPRTGVFNIGGQSITPQVEFDALVPGSELRLQGVISDINKQIKISWAPFEHSPQPPKPKTPPLPETVFIPPIALMETLFPIAIVSAFIHIIYAQKPDSRPGHEYGVKAPGGVSPSHTRKFYKEFLLPNWGDDSAFLDPLYEKYPTVARSEIFSDFSNFRKKLTSRAQSVCSVTFGAIYFPTALQMCLPLTTKILGNYTKNEILPSVLAYVFAIVLSNQATILSIGICSIVVNGTYYSYVFLSEKTGGSKPSLNP